MLIDTCVEMHGQHMKITAPNINTGTKLSTYINYPADKNVSTEDSKKKQKYMHVNQRDWMMLLKGVGEVNQKELL